MLYNVSFAKSKYSVELLLGTTYNRYSYTSEFGSKFLFFNKNGMTSELKFKKNIKRNWILSVGYNYARYDKYFSFTNPIFTSNSTTDIISTFTKNDTMLNNKHSKITIGFYKKIKFNYFTLEPGFEIIGDRDFSTVISRSEEISTFGAPYNFSNSYQINRSFKLSPSSIWENFQYIAPKYRILLAGTKKIDEHFDFTFNASFESNVPKAEILEVNYLINTGHNVASEKLYRPDRLRYANINIGVRYTF